MRHTGFLLFASFSLSVSLAQKETPPKIVSGVLLSQTGLIQAKRIIDSPFLSRSQIWKLKDPENDYGANKEKAEVDYQKLVHHQTLSDLIQIYSPENEAMVRITYPEFTPDDKRGSDLGFGFHVVRRLHLNPHSDQERIIDVNEHWDTSPTSHGLLLPDEIRVKSLVFSGQRHVRGSAALYLFDSFRVLWNEEDKPQLMRQSRFFWNKTTKSTEKKDLRTPITAPFSCRSCHNSQNNKFADPFLDPGMEKDHEAIVQDTYFNRPLDQTNGFRLYMEFLSKKKSSDGFVKAVYRDLLEPRKSLRLPNMLDVLKESWRTFYYIGGDSPVLDHFQGYFHRWPGIYNTANGKYWDTVYQHAQTAAPWWAPEAVIPSEY